jgi:hypothetical protein
VKKITGRHSKAPSLYRLAFEEAVSGLLSAKPAMSRGLRTGQTGQATDIDIQAKEILRTREELNRILAHHTGQSMEKIQRDTDRNFFMTAEQAKEYRIVDEVISSEPTTRPDPDGAVTAARAEVLVLRQEAERRAQADRGSHGVYLRCDHGVSRRRGDQAQDAPERAAFFSAWATKKLRGVCVCASALYGNTATRMSEIVPSDGAYAYGGHSDIDALYKQQARETDPGSNHGLDLNQGRSGPPSSLAVTGRR